MQRTKGHPIRRIGAWVVTGLLLGTAGCGALESRGGVPAASLYDRLGGTAAISAVVDQFVANVAQDQRINGRFATTDIPKLKRHLVDQVCTASGGPCTYAGRDMKATHAGMKISNADFTALVEDLVKALKTFNVPEAEKNELLGLLGPMKNDIVEVP
ncbi:MAG: group 1 truncated hemoglobin [Nitrospirota bacterium]|nr:group 1 truncated hemoglobin [Nitrospirota bacterium]